MIKAYLRSIAEGKIKGIVAAGVITVLSPLALLYGLVIRLLIHSRSAGRKKMPCAVISVGNITWGGSGKTPLVEFIARFLKNSGRSPAIISRGYGRSAALAQGDEPLMLQSRLPGIPVCVDSDRGAACLRVVRGCAADTAILDDGFQQWGIAKDLEIVTLDALNPFGNGRLMPAGMLREPLSSLARADIFLLTRCERVLDTTVLKQELKAINPGASIFCSRHAASGFFRVDNRDRVIPADTFDGKQVAVFSGIAQPESFEETLRRSGARIALAFQFVDHHCYKRAELERIVSLCVEQGIGTLITTEKDAVKLRGFEAGKFPVELWVLGLRLEFEGEDEKRFCDRLLRVRPA